MRIYRFALAAAAAPFLLSAQSLTLEERAKYHANRVLAPSAWLASGFGAAMEQWRMDPYEWGGGAAGYGRRFASARGYAGVRESFEFAIGAATHTDPRYVRSLKSGFGSRTRDAVVNSLVVPAGGGRRTFNFALAGGQLGAGFVSNLWFPDSANSTSDAFVRTGMGFGFAVFRNVVREFAPDIKRAIFRRRGAQDRSTGVSSVPSPVHP